MRLAGERDDSNKAGNGEGQCSPTRKRPRAEEEEEPVRKSRGAFSPPRGSALRQGGAERPCVLHTLGARRARRVMCADRCPSTGELLNEWYVASALRRKGRVRVTFIGYRGESQWMAETEARARLAPMGRPADWGRNWSPYMEASNGAVYCWAKEGWTPEAVA